MSGANIQDVDRILTHGVELAWQARRLFVESLAADGSLTCADSRIVRNDKLPTSDRCGLFPITATDANERMPQQLLALSK